MPLTQNPWKLREGDFPDRGTLRDQRRFLLRYAILAPSSHNTQPWHFAHASDGLAVFRDPARWLQVADADRRELHLSVGCALENLLIAAEHFGFDPAVHYFPDGEQSDLVALVSLPRTFEAGSVEGGGGSRRRSPELFEAIPRRRTDREAFKDRDIPPEELDRLRSRILPGEEAAGLDLVFLEDRKILDRLEEIMVRADARQFSDPAWREELGYWIGQGAFGTSGLMSRIGRLAVRHLDLGGPTARKDSRLLLSTPVIGVITGPEHPEDPEEGIRTLQVRAGMFWSRLALAATAAGLATHPMSQVLQVPEQKEATRDLLDDEGRQPLHLFRLGYGAQDLVPTPRRPIHEVLLED